MENAEIKKGRKMKGNEKRIARSIRIEPGIKAQIEEIFGSIQKWFDEKIENEFGGETYEAEIIKQPTKETKKHKKTKPAEVSIDDF